MRADQRKYHYIYKIIRVDGKYYIGMHSTDNLDDGYFGSGTLLSKSIKKHGLEKHSREILEFLPCRLTLKAREKELVNEECLGDKLCMNLKLGGDGGWDHLNSPEGIEKRRPGFSKWASAGHKAQRELMKIEEYRAKRLPKILAACAKGNASMLEKYPDGTWKGKSHSDETKQKMRKSKNVGEANSQFGKCWITNGLESRKIDKHDLNKYLDQGYKLGRVQRK